MRQNVKHFKFDVQYNLSKTATLKKTKTCFSRPIIAQCRSKVLQKAPRGAFWNTFDLHEATNRNEELCFVYFLSGHRAGYTVCVISIFTGTMNGCLIDRACYLSFHLYSNHPNGSFE